MQYKKNEKPKLSVCVVTYNQEAYIRECLQSIVDQETNFAFEVLVADDCSSDGTAEIVNEFVNRYPTKVFSQNRSINFGAFKNYKSVHASASGQYVAHVDGDDYCLPGKLQKQVDFLEANPVCNLVSHRMRIGDDKKYWAETKKNPIFLDINYLLLNHPCFLNSSMMYRRLAADEIFLQENFFIDFYVYVHFALKAPIGSIEDVLGYYRTGIGISSRQNLMTYIQEAIDLAAKSLGEIPEIRRSRSKSYLSYAIASLMEDNFDSFKKNLSEAIKADRKWMLPYGFLTARISPMLIKIIIRRYKNRKMSYVPNK